MKLKTQLNNSLPSLQLSKLIINACLIMISFIISTLSLSLSAQAAKIERWFEVEVILFKQLEDKSKLKEQFSNEADATNLPKYKKTFDLLSPYLQSDLTTIKQAFSRCNNTDDKTNFLLSQQQVNTKKLFYKGVTEKAEYLDLNNPRLSKDKLCLSSQADFERISNKQQLAHSSLDGFIVKTLAKRLNTSGSHIKSQPYLIADKDLLLKDINTRLRWSKQFKPLLHFGWRQAGVTRTKAIPMKFFAGQHIENDYQQALNNYQIELDNHAKLQKQLHFKQEQANNSNVTNSTKHTNTEHNNIKQKAIAQLLADIDTFNGSNTDNIIIKETVNQLTEQQLNDLLVSKVVSGGIITQPLEQSLEMILPPVKPLQPWFLDGFFKIHLDHYLYITADFNVLNSLPIYSSTYNSKQKPITPSKEKKTKLINFSQNRRVITGEIHYFDHPYIGMIVQIRRFDPTKPADEAVTQAIK